MTELAEIVAEFEAKGGQFALDGNLVEVKYPPEERQALTPILETLRANREAVVTIIRERSCGVPGTPECPPLPPGVRLLRYQPKTPPVAIAPISIVSDVDRFIKVCLHELDARLNHPVQIRAGGSVFEILTKLAEVGVELAIEPPSGLQKRP